MGITPLSIIIVASLVTVVALAARDVVRASLARRRILDDVLPLFEHVARNGEAAGFPFVDGRYENSDISVKLIPDTMTIRRLPQLWLDVTLIVDLPLRGRGMAVLVRPSGADYYSLIEQLPEHLRAAANWPRECLVKGQSDAAQVTVAQVGDVAGAILEDMRVKEIAVTSRGVRIVRQLSEGRRGEHLLLRQSVFDDAKLEPATLHAIVADARRIAAQFSALRTA